MGGQEDVDEETRRVGEWGLRRGGEMEVRFSFLHFIIYIFGTCLVLCCRSLLLGCAEGFFFERSGRFRYEERRVAVSIVLVGSAGTTAG